ncbi:MAG: sulfotransferase [bacterium]
MRPDDLRDVYVSQARATVCAVAALVGGPFVNKSIGNSVRIPALARLFPNALFVHVKRDLALTAQSHYLNYLDQRLADGSVKRWTSSRPPEYERLLDLPLVEKATAQVYYIDKCVEHSLRGVENTMIVHYGRICADPGTLIEQMFAHEAMSAVGLVRRREPPAGFTESRSVKVERRVFRRIESMLRQLDSESG